MSASQFTITTSWDDGHVLDARVADLLDRYGLKGTFYIAREYLPERLSDSQLRDLSARHEIGAHTLTHPVLTDIPLAQAREEIAGSRAWLQDVIGQEVRAFCYPRGYSNPALQTLTQESGYSMARGVSPYQFTPGSRYDVATTIHIYPFPFRPTPYLKDRVEPIRRALPYVRRLGISPLALGSWRALAMALLERAAVVGGVWHLWGHSWEVEKFGMWDELEAVLIAASRYKNARHVVNSELV
jgi:peptidoglycan/xylan/chitin deacetylase (PgdA/CDA1 family)